MKKYLLTIVTLILIFLGFEYLYYQRGFYIDLDENPNVTSDYTISDKKIYINKGNGKEEFEIRGVDIGTGIPGKWSTEFAIEEKTYLEWFDLIKQMGANTIRIYTVNSPDFYDAFYKYNKDNDDPLYLVQGVWVDESVMNSHVNGYDEEFIDAFIEDCKLTVDVIHGRRTIEQNEVTNISNGSFRKDVSKWTLGYIVGVEWESTVISYTNDANADNEFALPYEGDYFYTTKDASPFENMLARTGDSLMEYETNKYHTQRLLAFSNWANTDPFEYSDDIKKDMKKYASVDVEHIKTSDKVISGQFASYHIYPYYPNYINYLDDWTVYGIDEPKDYLIDGEVHSYEAYLSAIVNHHSMPVIISEYGVPSSRGIAAVDTREGFNHGNLSEDEQADIIIECYKEIMEAGCAGSIVFSWQDEWAKKTWNTNYATNARRTVYWSDYQTVEQSFGLLGYDTGYKDNCYNDNIFDEWLDKNLISTTENLALYMRNDERYLYFRIHNEDMDFENDTYYIPLDVTPRSGSTNVDGLNLIFNKDADFLIKINGKNNSDILVQERYESIASLYSNEVYSYDMYLEENVPAKDSNKFVDIVMCLQEPIELIYGDNQQATVSTYKTGKLKYGNGNPYSDEYISNSDYYCSGKDIEIRIPWALLNFSDPSLGEIHDDYYENFGIDYLKIDEIYAGIALGDNDSIISLDKYKLDTWNEKIDVHPYLKAAYYALQDEWTANDKYISNRSEKEVTTVNVVADYSIPALMYHDFKADGAVEEAELGEYAIYASEFADDLKYLEKNGYTTLNTADLIAIKEGKMQMPKKPIILTIDDGRYGVYEIAYPLLKQYEMKAVLSTIGSFIDEESIAATKQVNTKNYRTFSFSTWNEIREMVESGCIEVVSHSYELHDYEEVSQYVKDDDWRGIITHDVLWMQDTLVRKNIKSINALAYPFSIRSRVSDQDFFEMGYTILYTGDIYTIRDDLNYSYESKYASNNKTYLIPRTARYHGLNIEEYIKKFNLSVYNVEHYG